MFRVEDHLKQFWAVLHRVFDMFDDFSIFPTIFLHFFNLFDFFFILFRHI